MSSFGRATSDVIIVHQLDDLPFNRGALLNVGVRYLSMFVSIDPDPTLCFHDVDHLPINVDYGDCKKTTLLKPTEIKGKYFSPVVLCPSQLFYSVNGFSCGYWGWGYEDNDFYARVKELQLRSGSTFEVLSHPHSSLINGQIRPECMMNAQRFSTRDFSQNQTEGFSSTSNLNIKVLPKFNRGGCVNIGVDLTPLKGNC